MMLSESIKKAASETQASTPQFDANIIVLLSLEEFFKNQITRIIPANIHTAGKYVQSVCKSHVFAKKSPRAR